MSRDLFPKEIIENSSEANFAKHSVKTKLIYISILLIVVTALIALPFIYTDISIKSQGVIKPFTNRSQLISLVSGKIDKLYIHNNSQIAQGQVIAKIACPLLKEKIAFNRQRNKQVTQYVRDLVLLQKLDSASIFRPISLSVKYMRSLLAFRQQAHNGLQKIKEVSLTYKRNKTLFERKMSSKATYEESLFALESVRNNFRLLLKQQLNKWQADQIAYQEEQKELVTNRQQLEKQQNQYVIKASVSGTIQNMTGIYEGSFISANETLAEISPDTGLIAECYVLPQDIGLLKQGMKAKFQVSAFDYNRWGILKGNIQEISNDVTLINNRPVFKVRCTLNQFYLSLQNGYKGKLKKGMTFQARFMITKRSLFQLLYDNIDDWLNPRWNSEIKNTEQAMM